MIRRSPALLSALLALAACDGGARPAADPPPEWSIAEELRIGGGTAPEDVLTRLGDVLPLPDGGVWIVQPDDGTVRIHARDGAFVRRVGGRGQGPGEFTSPGSIGWWRGGRDTIWIADPFARRISLFTAADGTFRRSFATPPVVYQDVFVVGAPAVILADASALAVAAYGPGVEDRRDFPVVRFDPESGRVHGEIARLASTATVAVRWQGRTLATGGHPFPTSPIVAWSPAADRLLVIDRSDPADPAAALLRLTVIRTAASPSAGAQTAAGAGDGIGDTLWTRGYRHAPVALPRPEIDSVYAERIAGFQRFTRLEGRVSDEEAEQAYRASVAAPRFRPAVAAARLAPDGTIWLEWSAAPGEPRALWMLDADGEPLASVRPGRALDVRAAAGASLWSVERDSLDVPHLVRHAISPPRP